MDATERRRSTSLRTCFQRVGPATADTRYSLPSKPYTGRRPLESRSAGENRLHAVKVTNAVLSTRDESLVVAQDGPASIGLAQLVRGEVVHDFVLLTVYLPGGEDDVCMMSTRAREPVEPTEQLIAVAPIHVVNRAA